MQLFEQTQGYRKVSEEFFFDDEVSNQDDDSCVNKLVLSCDNQQNFTSKLSLPAKTISEYEETHNIKEGKAQAQGNLKTLDSFKFQTAVT